MSTSVRVNELARNLAKAKEEGDESTMLSILESLDEVEMTIPLLKSSDLGRIANVIAKSAAFRTAAPSAKRLVLKWKEMVKLTKSKRKKKRRDSSPNKSSTPNTSSSTKSETVPSESIKSANGSAQSSKSEKTENAFVRPLIEWETGDTRRDRAISRFIEVLRPEVDSKELVDFQAMSAEIERALGTLYGSDSKEYAAKFRDLHFNLKRNGELVAEVLLGHISADKLVRMSSEDLADRQLKEKRLRDKEWAMKEAAAGGDLDESKAMTDEYRCGKCGKRKCSYTQAQTRGADEPMTTFVSCLTCGNRWKC